MSDDRHQKKYAGGLPASYNVLSSKQLAHAIREQRKSTSNHQANSSSSMPTFHEPLPVKSSILQRPLHAKSQMTKENLDSTYEHDSMRWERKRELYQQAAKSPAHNHGPSILTLYEQGHIASRGKGKGITQSSYHPSLLVGVKASDRPSSAPHQHQLSSSIRQKLLFNPILQDQGPEPQEPHHTKRPTSAFNPILGHFRPSPQDPHSSPHVERPATPGRRARVESGITWGAYNPITHEWGLPPSDPRYIDQDAMAARQLGINGRQKKKVGPGTNRDQGVYNPITNVWIVAPCNPRIAEGLHFQTPTTQFPPARLQFP